MKFNLFPKPDPPLQALRIPTGWEMQWNGFLDQEPIFEDRDEISMGFGQDILSIAHKRNSVLLDLGWYPGGDPAGEFGLVAVRFYEDRDNMILSWGKPLRKLDSRSKSEIVQTLEDWLWHYGHHKK